MSMTGGRVRLPNPHQGQKAIINSPARFKWLAAGRRWRKTTMGMAVVVEGALKGERWLWVAPTFDQCRIGWSEMYSAAGGCAEFRRGRMEVDFPNGGSVIFRSLDNPDNARGHTADGIVMDEAPMIKERGWYEVLRPIISDTGGKLLAMGTPKGRNWFWREFQYAAQRDDSAAWIAPTLGVAIQDGTLIRRPHLLENPSFPFEEAQRLYDTLPELVFGQEFLAEFITRTGLVYGDFDREIHVKERDEREFTHWMMGVDEGYTNPAVILLIGIDGDGCLHVHREFYERGKLPSQVTEQALTMGLHRQISVAVVDSSAAGMIAELSNAGLSAQAHKGRVLDGIGIVMDLLKVQGNGLPRLTVDPSCTSTIYEFDSYVWKEGKDAPIKQDDHAMDALRYAADWLMGGELELSRVVYDPVRIGNW